MRESSLDTGIRENLYGPALSGMPEGTELQHDVRWCMNRDAYILRARFTSGDNVTLHELELYGAEMYDERRVLDRINEFFRELQRHHWLATYNVWPGWRI